ncbi:MAG: ATP-binding protein [Bdellovibrionota bacterium]
MFNWPALSQIFSAFPPEEQCRHWPAELLVTTLIANGMAGLALLSIAASILTLVQRTRIPYPGLFIVFSVCLGACGMGRLSGIWATWDGSTWPFALLGILTALSSTAAAVCLRRMMPRLVKAVQGLTLSETRRRMLEDYSDELRAVNGLREKEARDFEAIVSSSSDQIYRLGLDGKFEYTSPAVTKFFGMPKAELTGKGWENLTLDEETHRHLTDCQNDVFHGGREARGSLSVLSLEGLRHFDYLCSPILENGRVIAVTFNFRDVTEKRVFETELVRAYSEMERRVQSRTEELSVSRKRFEDLVNTIDGIVWEADVGQAGFSFVSSQAERITGHSAARWQGEKRFWQSILHPEDLAKITGDRYLQPEKKKDLQTEYRILTADNRILWMRDHIRVIFEHGRAVKMRGIMVDVTEQKKAEIALQKEKELSQQAARVKSDFLANMSHEIRTPLNAIVGMSSLALDCQVDEEARDCLGTVKTAADSLLTLVNDILDFSKIEAGGIRLELSDFRLRSLLKNATDVIQPLAQVKGITLRCEDGTEPGTAVRGDPGRLLQVLLNLLSNAVKFTPKGGEVKLCLKRAADARFRFEIRDNGIGISESSRKELFLPFIQADPSTARKFGGTGLGLSICKRLVGLMGGVIDLDSMPGQGSTFWFELPLAAAHSEIDSLEEEDETGGGAPASRSNARVLVADDNPANQKVILRLLEKLGYSPEVVTNGREALAAFENRHFDLVLMDCQMPEMDGYEATRRIRATEQSTSRAGHTPVVALTAHALSGDRDKCREAGMDDYLSKPVTLRELARATSRWTKRAPRLAEAAPSASTEAGSQIDPILNMSYLKNLEQLNAPGKSDIIRELAVIFLESGAEKLAALRGAAAKGETESVRFGAHSLKSTCHNVGAVRSAKVCGELEELAERANAQGFAEKSEFLLKRLEKEILDAKAELARLLRVRDEAA